MHYFKYHIGDNAALTNGFSLAEDGAYVRMLARYYKDERPLPASIKDVQSLVGARRPAEKAAVEKVLKAAFSPQEDGWHDAKIDEALAVYRRNAETSRVNGRLGGRMSGVEDLHINGLENQGGPQTGPLTSNQEPVTINQQPPTMGAVAPVGNLIGSAGAPHTPTIGTSVIAEMFKPWLLWLQETTGKKESECRGLMGKWRKLVGDGTLVDILRDAHVRGVAEPVGWITKAVKQRTLLSPELQ